MSHPVMSGLCIKMKTFNYRGCPLLEVLNRKSDFWKKPRAVSFVERSTLLCHRTAAAGAVVVGSMHFDLSGR